MTNTRLIVGNREKKINESVVCDLKKENLKSKQKMLNFSNLNRSSRETFSRTITTTTTTKDIEYNYIERNKYYIFYTNNNSTTKREKQI
jgi:hypothetical protein